MHRVVVLAFPDVVLFDAAIALQVFGHPDQHDRYAVTLCAPWPGAVPSGEGVPLVAARGLDALDDADTVLVPGFSPHEGVPDGALGGLRAASARGARVVSICTGAFALAEAGLLDGRRATTHWHHTDELARRFPAVRVYPDVLFVLDDPDLATSAGLAAGIDLCLALVRADHGAETAAAVARRMVVPPHRDGGQAQLLDRPLPPSGESFAGTCAWARTRLADPLTVADLARHAGYAPRTFARRFRAQTGTTPLQWLTAQRVHVARRLLEHTDDPVATVAHRTGLGTAANLRALLARDAHTTPSAYRRTFRGALTAR